MKSVLFVGGPRPGLEEVEENYVGVRMERRPTTGWYRKTDLLVEVWDYTDDLPTGIEIES